jgi:hypothetical protein
MPREQVEWYVKKSLGDDDKLHARQCCTYYSTVNVNKTNYPYSSSFEQEQTWTLTKTMAHDNKRYQSSIENIHLSIPSILTIVTPFASKTNQIDYKNDKIKLDRSISLLPPFLPSGHCSLLSHHSNRVVPQQHTSITNNSSFKKNSLIIKSQSIDNPMRIMHVNGEYIVRI